MAEGEDETTNGCPTHILDFIGDTVGETNLLVETAKSSQQQVFLLVVDCAQASCCWKKETLASNRLVVRIWRGSSRWWNLNHPTSANALEQIAQHELWGYGAARQVLLDTDDNRTGIRIPQVLHASVSKSEAWAVIEYVGALQEETIDTSWIDGMIQVRDEFGFPEPHPRWGRVPVDLSTAYALQVLTEVVIPLHSAVVSPSSNVLPAHTYESMCMLYQREFNSYIVQASDETSPELHRAIQKLCSAIGQLVKRCDSNLSPPSLPPVLCHLDLQPQNIVFAKRTGDQISRIISVFDWEEAAYADPRFELLLLGRKVCANRKQAKQLWKYYEEHVGVTLGPIDPWLELETVHSLTTLLLQATAGGGRSPWETLPDLWGKIEREFLRLPDNMGSQ